MGGPAEEDAEKDSLLYIKQQWDTFHHETASDKVLYSLLAQTPPRSFFSERWPFGSQQNWKPTTRWWTNHSPAMAVLLMTEDHVVNFLTTTVIIAPTCSSTSSTTFSTTYSYLLLHKVAAPAPSSVGWQTRRSAPSSNGMC
jgi:hypothetical protein